MVYRSNKAETNFVTAFLSCSVRPEDRPLVDAIEDRVLTRMGFRCLTIGRNISMPDQVDDAVRELVQRVDCLIGVATVRFDAADRSLPNRTLCLATPYLLEEAAMAHQRRLPFLVFKTPEVTLQGVAARNLYLEVLPALRNGRPVFQSSKSVVRASLEDLKKRSMDARAVRGREEFLSGLGKLSTVLVGAYAASNVFDWLSQPNCFGNFYYQDLQCSECSYKPQCKVEKARRASSAGY